MAEPTFLDALSLPMVQRGLVAGSLCGLCCASLSPLVVLRRMAFVGDGIAHAAFGGMGIALFFVAGSRFEDNSVRAITILWCLVLGFAIGKVTRRGESGKLAEDSAIGIAFSVSMALGALLIMLKQQRERTYVQPIDALLFGNIFLLTDVDVVLLGALTVVILAVLAMFFKEIFFYAFDARLAEVSGVDARFIHYLFIMLLVLVVVISSRVVGIVLVSASLIIPGVIALRLCTRLLPAILTASVIGSLSFFFGMYLSHLWRVSPGSAVILLQFVCLLAVKLLLLIRGPKVAAH
ncbi:MAG TPA: metal ABC transporter permease [Planctomycetota bacterium]|nr:metal ABC transporter permease [Planctomycetota bacterium]